MKFSSAVIGGQVVLAATIFANPIANIATSLIAARFPAPMPAAIPGLSKERGPDDEAQVNNVCGKLKRDAEAAAATAAEKSALYEKAVVMSRELKQGGVIAREVLPGKINERGPDDEAQLNNGCAKLKRDAEAAAVAAASSYKSYAEMLARL